MTRVPAARPRRPRRPRPARCAASLLLVLAAGCGGDDFDPPACEDGEAVIEIHGDGELSETTASITGHIFVNKLSEEDPGSLVLSLAGDDTVWLEWDELVANGGSVDARGGVDFSASGGEVLGNCESDGTPGTLILDEDGDGGAFHIERLRPGADCAAAVADADIVGCFRYQLR